MGRSVSYLNNAEFVLYFPFESYRDENGEYDADIDSMNWDDTMECLKAEITKRLPSYSEVDKWDNRETRIFLENNLCSIGISEYCGLVSLSVAPRDLDGYDDTWQPQFAARHAAQIRPILEKCLDELGLKRLNKIGTFSNGESVFNLAKV